MDFSGFAGNGRPLKWVRTPLHDRDYRKTKQLEESLVQHRSGPEVHSQKSPVPSSDPSEKTSVVSIIRDISSKILYQRRNQKLLDASGTLSCGVTSGKCFARGHGGKKDRKRWNTIQFVVGGQHFQSPEWIFEGHPTTLLGSLEQRKLFFNARRMCYEFPDVLPDVFIAVLEYYQTGLLTRPQRLTLNFFLEQVEVFCLEPEANELLLKNEGVHKSRVSQEVIDGFDQPGLRNWLWNFLEYPSFSRGASVYSFFSFFMTALAVTIFVIETQLSRPRPSVGWFVRQSSLPTTCFSRAFRRGILRANSAAHHYIRHA
ncbi:hypothetical protein BV898_10539 [Hypsibius exemplaris]|uniref:Potassium channel tetramerisation-type BTB domain-containing protein n=1 Tax=Hypsibius exemplaris TaxID=2072580 RepID=A0A1W0WJB1_HYPEX|nr:hypothetical protein BV898_10539 [Hypsibius exemplaris]